MANADEYQVWTMQISNWRYARQQEIPMLDITVKSGIQAFAPTWENLREYKAGNMSQTEYSHRYYRKVLGTVGSHARDWERLQENKKFALACYCRAGEYCHRHLFAVLAVTYLQSIGQRVQFMGELLPPRAE